ncbi:hypothetical protein Hanom_Chr15g01347121 [Helianthus anomalus]
MYWTYWSPGLCPRHSPVSPAISDAMFDWAPAAAQADFRPETILPSHERLAGVTAE